jgi:hypothetical protein
MASASAVVDVVEYRNVVAGYLATKATVDRDDDILEALVNEDFPTVTIAE